MAEATRSDNAGSLEPVALNIPGLSTALQMQVHAAGDRHISRRIRDEGIWEPYETALVQAILAPAGVFVDVGANIGYYSVLAASIVGPEGRVVAFEPDTTNCALLRHNLMLNGYLETVAVFEAGLTESSAAGRLYLSEDNAGDHQIFAVDGTRHSRAISLLNGSDCLRPLLQRIDLLKVDVQGAEYAVLAGLLPLLRELPAVPNIIVELTPLSLRQAGSSGRRLIELLATLGQPLWIIDHVEHQLAACSAGELAQWCDDVDAVAGDAGFMNILVGAAPAAAGGAGS